MAASPNASVQKINTNSPNAPPNVYRRELFPQNPIQIISSADFADDSVVKIGLKYHECIIILFHSHNQESQQLADIWYRVAQIAAGPVFAACDLVAQKQVAKNFMNLISSDSPMRIYGLKQIPFILTYRNGMPQAYYNGDRSVQALVDWSITLACNKNYTEVVQLGASVSVAPEDNIEMTGWAEYKDHRTGSTQYITGSPIRGFNTTEPLVVAGSPAARQASVSQQQFVQRENAQRSAEERAEAELEKELEVALPAQETNVPSAQPAAGVAETTTGVPRPAGRNEQLATQPAVVATPAARP